MSNLTWVLVRENTHEEVMVGDTITSFRGDGRQGGCSKAAHHQGNRQARGVCSIQPHSLRGVLFASVFDLAWIQKKGGVR
jgi:hypothetical protein